MIGKGIRILYTFILVVVLASVLYALYYTGNSAFNNIDQLKTTVIENSKPNDRLILLKNILNELDQGEKWVQSYALAHDKESLLQYKSTIEDLQDKLTEMQQMTAESEEARVDSLQVSQLSDLISLKKSLWTDFIKAQQDYRIEEVLDEVIETAKEHNVSDTLTVEKKPFFKRLFGKKEEKMVYRDTNIVQAIQEKATNIKKEEKRVYEKNKAKELEIIAASKLVTDSLYALMDNMQELEFSRIQEKVNQSTHLSEKTSEEISFFGYAIAGLIVLAILLIVLFVIRSFQYERTLNRAKNQAEKLAQTKEIFASTVTHEVRNPLHAIEGFTNEALDNEKDKGAQKRRLQIIQQSTQYLLQVVNEVLDFSKMEAGKLKMSTVEFSPKKMADEIESMFSFQIHSKGLKWNCSIDDDLPVSLKGDAMRVKQILINLISNAVKFTEKGGIELKIRKMKNNQEDKPSACLVEFQVIDTGVGIPEKSLKNIFEEFNQAHSAAYGGTGLGLNLVQKMARFMGGAIAAESKEGKGSRFSLQLPFQVGTTVKKNNEKNGRENQHVLKNLAGKIIYLADDEEFNTRLFVNMLKNASCNIETFGDGKSLFTAMQKSPANLVFLDLNMPTMDGYQTTEKIREELQNKKVPIIAITGHEGESHRDKCLKMGMNDVLVKPFGQKELFDIIALYT